MHLFGNHLSRCPWCELENSGIVYFIDLGQTVIYTESGFVFSRAWAAIEAVTAPPQVSGVSLGSQPANPTPLPPGVSDGEWLGLFRGILVMVAVGLVVAIPASFLFVAFGTWILWANLGTSDKQALTREKTRRMNALNAAKKEHADLLARVGKEAGPAGFFAEKQRLAKLRDEYIGLGETEKNELQGLHTSAEARQKLAFLDRCFIDSAVISGVGAAKKAALRSFGIETAADVTASKVRGVRGFGEKLTHSVLGWKKSCEQRFKFDARNAVSLADRNSVHAKFVVRKNELEAALSGGASVLHRYRAEAAVKVRAFDSILIPAAQKLAQAEADVSLV